MRNNNGCKGALPKENGRSVTRYLIRKDMQRKLKATPILKKINAIGVTDVST